MTKANFLEISYSIKVPPKSYINNIITFKREKINKGGMLIEDLRVK
nr:MAG TPA: hypothetical protein [Caudoviricetes sp.]